MWDLWQMQKERMNKVKIMMQDRGMKKDVRNIKG